MAMHPSNQKPPRIHRRGDAVGAKALQTSLDQEDTIERSEELPFLEDAIASEWMNRAERHRRQMIVAYQAGSQREIRMTRDISQTGICVHTPRPPSSGAWVLLHLEPSNGNESVHLVSQVVWSRPGDGFGARFHNPAPFTRQVLDTICSTTQDRRPTQHAAQFDSFPPR